MRILSIKSLLIGALGTALLLAPGDALRALGLGEARVGSYLGQPLDVTVRLIGADDMALDSLTIAPASAADHERLGVPSEALALGLDVTVDRRVDPPTLRIRSRRNVDDPVVQVLIDARWASGRVLREYTLFLDPPLLDLAPPVRRPETQPVPVEPVAEPAPAPPAEVRPAPARPAPEQRSEPAPTAEPVAQARIRDDVVGPVGAGQTLWGIAAAWRPDTSMTMNQVMLAIFERNPQAFIDGNVNRLRRGAELTMPDADAVLATSAAEAERRIRDQIQAWRQETRPAEVPVIADLAVPDVERRVEPEPEPVAPEVVHRLEVVPPDREVMDEGTMVSADAMREAHTRLDSLEDQMWSDSLESDEFYRHIASIREAIESGETAGLAVADEEMARLESRLRDARLAREEADRRLAELAPEDDEVGAYFRDLEEEFAVGDTPAEATAEQEPASPARDPAAAEVQQPPAPAAGEPRAGLGWLLWAVLIVVVLGGLGGALFWLRSRSAGAGTVAGSGDKGVALARARARVASKPSDLAAHLALLRVLSERDDPDAFSAALDDMYRHVDDDGDTAWQQALTLAARSAPDHPLLTPPETANVDFDDGDDGLDDRTREMLGILEKPDSPDDREFAAEMDVDDTVEEGDDFFEPVDDQQRTRLQVAPDSDEDESAGEEVEGVDLDLAELSDRLDGERDEGEDADTSADAGYEFDFSSRSEATTADDSGEHAAEASPADEPLDLDDDTLPGVVDSDEDDMSDFERDLLEIEGAGGDDAMPEAPAASSEQDSDEEFEAFLRDERDRGEEDLAEEPADEIESTDAGDAAVEGSLADDDAEVKLDLARAYLSMDDPDSARTLLEEVLAGGSAAMREQARQLIDSIS